MHPARTRLVCLQAVAIFLIAVCCALTVAAQSSSTFDEEEADPIKLFDQGQTAHERGDLQKALEFYDEAIKLRPEFPEAEYQRAIALISLERLPEAEQGFRRAIKLRADWALPYAALGDMLERRKDFSEAEQMLAQALKLEPKNQLALVTLTNLRLQTQTSPDALRQLLSQLRAATGAGAKAAAGLWMARAAVERALDDKQAALASFNHVLELEPGNSSALIGRAEIFAAMSDFDRAIESARAASNGADNATPALLALARIYAQAGRCTEAQQALNNLPEAAQKSPETVALRNQMSIGCAATAEDAPALEKALATDPKNAALLARLCTLYRKDDPPRALEYCRRALEAEPRNADYATGYGAALVQARRFASAAELLQQVVAAVPDNYTAHANLATALYELKDYRAALTQYRWIIETKPDVEAAYYFIATAHDFLGEYEEALAAYEAFLSHADPAQYRLEIERINLRLPGLREQIRLKQGVKKKS